ncbi:putative RNA-binding protein [Leishmania major strain Friedlin]|uniref:Putative RNA-binding protein n=1 Tax=Leishmania major TaxID=5664 RepID=E9ADZ3_LEIMA|nr:putative RNA-binding protein [Leishmania major strain Friedlin]CAG9577871.1 RNA-binding_protein_-_putative [Leishmania major strain Friedlin]CBZ12472.1 putative RNA-binding protein [Leishmania major strain Friedlin]|eukprot:XP_003722214.1 putative RNA-binding protein [Leishmania major strain Friedlin]
MYFVAAAPTPVSPPGVIATSAPLPFGTPMKDMSISFSNSNSSTAVSAAPPSYEAVALDPKGPRSQTNLFVRKLASAVTEDDMRKLFEQYGTIMSFALMRDIHTGESLGTAFVRYSTHDEASAAMAALDGRELYGRPISIQWAKREHDSTPCGDARRKIRKLFVRNIPLDVTARHLRQIFSKFGSISNVTLHSDTAPAAARDNGDNSRPASQMRNIAFILFQDDDVAEQAVGALHNTCPFDSCEGIPLMVKLAEDNRDRIDRKQRFCEGSVANTTAKAFATAMMQSNHLCTAASVSPLTVPLSTPASATLSPPTLSMDVSHNNPIFIHEGHAASLPPSGQQTLPFTVSAPTATATPMLQTTVDANGNTAYFYVPPSPNNGVAQQALPASAAPGQYVIVSSGLQGFTAANRVVSQPSQPFYAAAAPPSVPQYYQTVTLPQVFADAQGQPLQPQSNVFVSGYYSYSPNPQSSPQTPQQVPIFEVKAAPMTHPLHTGASAPKAASDVFQNQSPLQHQLAHAQPPFSVSPQLSSPGGVREPVPTTVFSATDSPVNGAINSTNTVPLQLQVPMTLVPHSAAAPLSANAKARGHSCLGPTRDGAHAAALMCEVPMPSMVPCIEDDDVTWGNVSAKTPAAAGVSRSL